MEFYKVVMINPVSHARATIAIFITKIDAEMFAIDCSKNSARTYNVETVKFQSSNVVAQAFA